MSKNAPNPIIQQAAEKMVIACKPLGACTVEEAVRGLHILAEHGHAGGDWDCFIKPNKGDETVERFDGKPCSLQDLREDANWGKDDLDTVLGFGSGLYASMENGWEKPIALNAKKLSILFGVTEKELMEAWEVSRMRREEEEKKEECSADWDCDRTSLCVPLADERDANRGLREDLKKLHADYEELVSINESLLLKMESMGSLLNNHDIVVRKLINRCEKWRKDRGELLLD